MDNGDNETVTSIQVRAARALRAWSQKDLAAKAGVAVSTIADFERGQRTPVANNLAAIRKSLEESGIIVRDGGVVDGSRIMQPPPSVAGGVPLRWVEASDLSDWANSRNCQEMMPELISRLIRAELGPAARSGFRPKTAFSNPVGTDCASFLSDSQALMFHRVRLVGRSEPNGPKLEKRRTRSIRREPASRST